MQCRNTNPRKLKILKIRNIRNMKKTIIIILLGAFATIQAQESESCRGVRAGLAYMPGISQNAAPICDIDYSYSGKYFSLESDILQLSKSITAGIHIGLGQATYREQASSYNERTIGLHYGVGMRLHMLQMMGCNNQHWDISLSGRIGSYWSAYLRPINEYGLGLDVAYYPFKHWGIYASTNWGRFSFVYEENPYLASSSTLFNIGICFRY